MNKSKIALTLGIVCFILTIGICVQINTITKSNVSVSQTLSKDSLRDEVLKWKEKYDNISKEVDVSEKQLDKIREASSKNDGLSEEIEKEISLNNNLLGLTNVSGQGVEITLKDDPNATRETIGIFDDISNHIIHDADLRAVVNALKNAGAEAISINGQRVVNTTAITCIGNVIKVNNEKLASPFTIKAIGLPESLAGVEMPGSYIDILRENGIVVDVKKSNNIEIQKYTGAISAKYMQIYE